MDSKLGEVLCVCNGKYSLYGSKIEQVDVKNSVEITENIFFFFSSRRRHTRLQGDWSSDVCSSDL